MRVPVLSDEVIVLRAWTPDDAPEVHRMVQDPQIPRFMAIPPNHTLEGVRRWLASRDADWESGEAPSFAIASTDDGRLLGSVGLEVSRDDPAIAEIGYWVAAEERGAGVATRAVALITRWAFGELGLERLEITTHEDNPASQRVATANGFRREGVLRSYRAHHDRRVDLVMYARLREDRPGGAP